MTSKIKHRGKYRQGAAAVEFAVAISILLMLVFASIEFFRVSMLRHAVAHSSYLAARKGIIIGAKTADVKTAAQDHLTLLGVSGGTVTVTPNGIKDDTQVIEVHVEVPISGNSWISPAYFGGNMSGTTRMLTERAAADMNGALPPPSP